MIKIYPGIGGVAQAAKNLYVGADGVAREVTKGYIGDASGIARAIQPPPPVGIPISELPIGALVSAQLDGNATLIRLLHHGSPSTLYNGFEDTTTFMFENIIENRQWHSSETSNSYSGSTMHSYLNGAFLSRVGFANQIKQVRIPYRPGSGAATTVNSGANGLLATVWLLSAYETRLTRTLAGSINFAADGVLGLAYFMNFAERDARRIGYLEGVATSYWLRSPALSTELTFVGTVLPTEGQGGAANPTSLNGMRPALALHNTALVSATPNPDGSYNLLEA